MIAAMREACRDLARHVGRDPDELVEDWLERAAIREFDGGQSRADAERDALDELRRELAGPLAGERKGPRSAGALTAEQRDRASKK